MRYQLVGTLRSYSSLPPEVRVWDFGDDDQAALLAYKVWSKWMAEDLWQFRDWGWAGAVTCIKPGALTQLDLRVQPGPL